MTLDLSFLTDIKMKLNKLNQKLKGENNKTVTLVTKVKLYEKQSLSIIK